MSVFTATLKALINRATTLTDKLNNNNKQHRDEREYHNRIPQDMKYHVGELKGKYW